jgi:hypothetical protein
VSVQNTLFYVSLCSESYVKQDDFRKRIRGVYIGCGFEMPILFIFRGFTSLLNNKADDHRGDDDQSNGNENNLLNPDIPFLPLG